MAPAAPLPAPAASKPAAPARGASIAVRAIAIGHYGDVLRHPGSVFRLVPRTGRFSEVVLDKTGEPKTLKAGGLDHPVTREVDKTLSAEEQFDPRWMEKVTAQTADRALATQDVIDAEHDRILADRIARGGGAADSAAASGDLDVLT